MSFIIEDAQFKTTIEVVPPADKDPETVLNKIAAISHLPFDGFSVATNPVAKPRMSAMVFSHLLQEKTGKPAILHFTTRDHNRLGLQSELWGASALGIQTTIGVTGDASKGEAGRKVTTVADLSVYELIEMSKDAGMTSGAVLDFRPEQNGLAGEVKRLEKKVDAGCRFIVTQPVYDRQTAEAIHRAVVHLNTPVIMGILPLISSKHARFLHDKVQGIWIPEPLRQQFATTTTPVTLGTGHASEMLQIAAELFSGACVMPPFDRFDLLPDILPAP